MTISSQDFPTIAVIADAHFHDTKADFGFAGIEVGQQPLTMRSWSDTRQSTRVFNESVGALHAALDQVAARGIRHVVLLGDYTDDGQRATTERLRRILSAHSQAHGTAFYALPGNHDIFGPKGRHHTKEFLRKDGSRLSVTSDPKLPRDDVVVSEEMFCEGYPVGLMPMEDFGYMRRPAYLHWETPFGASDDEADRRYEIASPDGKNQYRLMDASYLLEPVAGLWLLMIDANVFEPLDGNFLQGEEAAFTDSTSGGWNAMLRSKGFILDWIADVSRRARLQGKMLLAFSHYPALDPFDGAGRAESLLFGETNVVRRTPVKAVEDALTAAGVTIHFSGHLHVEGLTQRGTAQSPLFNIAVPSLVAFPPAFKVVRISGQEVQVDTVEMSDLPIDAQLMQGYAKEAGIGGEAQDPAVSAVDYGDFLKHHKRALVHHRYFVKEWPADIVEVIRDKTVLDVVALFPVTKPGDSSAYEGAAELSMLDLIADWYCLRQGAWLALPHIKPQRLKLYHLLASSLGREASRHDSTLQGFLGTFFGALGLFLDRAEGGSPRVTLCMPTQGDEVPA